MRSFGIKVRWFFDGRRFHDGELSLYVRDGRIETLSYEGKVDFEFPGGLLLPGLVNAHTHLELGFLRGKLKPTTDFVSWLERVKELREKAGTPSLTHSVKEGLKEASSFGTTVVVDHTATGVWDEVGEGILRVVAARELVTDEEPSYAVTDLPLLKTALAPHSVYRLSPQTLKDIAQKARKFHLLSIHAAEHPAEIEFLLNGSGPLRKLLPPNLKNFRPPGTRPIDYLHSLGLLTPNTLLVHANYLADEEIELIKRSGAAVVYCPRSHAFFSHPPHPLPKLLAEGVAVLFGTDSLASCPDLNLLEEIRLAHKESGVEEEKLFECVTSLAAKFVWGDRLGRIAVGAPADFAVFTPPDPRHPLSSLLDAAPSASFLCCNGRVVHKFPS